MGLYRSALNLETVADIFERQRWSYDLAEGYLLTSFDNVIMAISVDEEREILLLEVPIVPGRGMSGFVESRPAEEANTAIYLMAVNYQLALGHFARDHSDGEIRYESSLPVAGALLSDEQLRSMLVVAVGAVQHHAPMLNNVLTGQISLGRALASLDTDHGIPPAMIV